MRQFPGKQFEVEWKPFFLNTELPKEGILIDDYVEQVYGKRPGPNPGRLEMTGESVGIHFLRDRKLYPTMDSHRLVEFAKRHGKQDEMIEALFHNYFEEGKNISDHSVLLDLAQSVSLPREQVREYLESSEDKEKVMKDYRNAVQNLRVRGVPHFVISNGNRKLALSGGQPPEYFVDAFEELS